MRVEFADTGRRVPPPGGEGPSKPVITMTVSGTREELEELARLSPPLAEPTDRRRKGEWVADWTWVQGSPLVGLATWLGKTGSRFMVKTITDHYLSGKG